MRNLVFALVIILSYSCDKFEYDSPIGLVRAIWLKNPSNEMIIAWNSFRDTDKDERYIVFDTVDHGNDTESYSYKKELDEDNSFKKMNNSFVRLENLKPDTRYYFQIIDDDAHSKRYWFKTAPADNKDLVFIAGGDSRNNRDIRQLANKMVAKLRVDAVMFGGDYTNLGTNNQWRNWFKDWELTIAKDGRLTPIIPTRGNHEKSSKVLTELFLVDKDNYFHTSFGDNFLNIITLDTNDSTEGDQKDWLKDTLNENSSHQYTFVQYHKPMRPHVKGKKEGTHYKSWADLFYKFEVDIVMESDSHLVKETFPIRPSSAGDSELGFVRDDENGTIYLGEGCWGAPLRENDDNKSWTKKSGSFNQFKWIKVSETGIKYSTIIIDKYIENLEFENFDPYVLPNSVQIWN